jgi:hypothetical protein
MENAGEVQVDPQYDDEVTKQELSKALNDVAAGQNRLAQMHKDVIELLDKRGNKSSNIRGGLTSLKNRSSKSLSSRTV